MIHVYGITDADAELPDGLRGLMASQAVRTVVHGELAAVVSDVEDAPRTREDLERHAEVQSAIAARSSIVPLRFGTLLEDEAEVRDGFLAPFADELREVLASVAGHVQMTLRAVYDEELLLREVVQAHPELKREADRLAADAGAAQAARIELGERLSRSVESLRLADEEHLVERLATCAEEILVEEPSHERMAARLQILVARDRRPALDRAVEELSIEQADRMTLRYVGPLAPYSFCDVTLDAEGAPWA